MTFFLKLTENRLAPGKCRQGVSDLADMGKITKALRRECEYAQKRKLVPFTALAEAARAAESTPDYQELVRQGHDPVHAVYTTTINLASTFLEFAADLPPFEAVLEFLSDAQDLYMPGYPPLSPITGSLFGTWTLFDVPFGPDQETVGECFAGLFDVLELGELREQALDQLRRSRLGLYELTASGGNRVHLREVVTNAELEALIPTGFRGETGQCLLVRLLPPLNGETPYHVAGIDRSRFYETLSCRNFSMN